MGAAGLTDVNLTLKSIHFLAAALLSFSTPARWLVVWYFQI